jgi:sporulation protein YlmC with PRC-barrel domain
MRIDKGEQVLTSEGEVVGEVERVVLDPKTKEVTHIVVTEGRLFNKDRVIPISMVESSNDNEMKLRKSLVDFDAFPVFEETHYIPMNKKDLSDSQRIIHENFSLFPYPPLTGISMDDQSEYQDLQIEDKVENIPEGSLALCEGALVRDVDGKRFGKVERVLTDSEGNHITHFVVSRGFIFKKRVLVPYEWVMSITEDEIHLAMGPTILKSLPAFNPNGSSS